MCSFVGSREPWTEGGAEGEWIFFGRRFGNSIIQEEERERRRRPDVGSAFGAGHTHCSQSEKTAVRFVCGSKPFEFAECYSILQKFCIWLPALRAQAFARATDASPELKRAIAQVRLLINVIFARNVFSSRISFLPRTFAGAVRCAAIQSREDVSRRPRLLESGRDAR